MKKRKEKKKNKNRNIKYKKNARKGKKNNEKRKEKKEKEKTNRNIKSLQGLSKSECEAKGVEVVYLEFLKNIHALIKSEFPHLKMQFWYAVYNTRINNL